MDISVWGNKIFNPKAFPRKGWEKSFKKMHLNGDDRLLFPDIFEDENLKTKLKKSTNGLFVK